MALRSVEFFSALVRWFDDTYESLLYGVNFKENVWWITTRVIRSIFEYYLEPDRDTPMRTSFGSDPHRRGTLVWGLIFFHLAEENMLSKTIKNHSIVVGVHDQCFVSNSSKKEALKAKILAGKVKDRVDELSDTLSSTTKSGSKLKTTVASSKKAVDQAASKVSALNKWSPRDAGVQGGCAPSCRAVSEESEGGDTMGVLEGVIKRMVV